MIRAERSCSGADRRKAVSILTVLALGAATRGGALAPPDAPAHRHDIAGVGAAGTRAAARSWHRPSVPKRDAVRPCHAVVSVISVRNGVRT